MKNKEKDHTPFIVAQLKKLWEQNVGLIDVVSVMEKRIKALEDSGLFSKKEETKQ